MPTIGSTGHLDNDIYTVVINYELVALSRWPLMENPPSLAVNRESSVYAELACSGKKPLISRGADEQFRGKQLG
jgi:hypothetical protein